MILGVILVLLNLINCSRVSFHDEPTLIMPTTPSQESTPEIGRKSMLVVREGRSPVRGSDSDCSGNSSYSSVQSESSWWDEGDGVIEAEMGDGAIGAGVEVDANDVEIGIRDDHALDTREGVQIVNEAVRIIQIPAAEETFQAPLAGGNDEDFVGDGESNQSAQSAEQATRPAHPEIEIQIVNDHMSGSEGDGGIVLRQRIDRKRLILPKRKPNLAVVTNFEDSSSEDI